MHGGNLTTASEGDVLTSPARLPAFATGARRAPRRLARLRGFESLTILADGRVLSTPRFPA